MANEIQNIIIKMNAAVSDRSLLTAVNTVFGVHRARIFEQGLDANDQQIGTYSTNPMSLSKSRQARNTGRTFFKGGYAEYKTAIGKNPGYMNLRNFDQLYADYGVISGRGSIGLGFQNPVNYAKAINIQKKQGKTIFAHNAKEIDLLTNVLAFEINRI